MGLLCNQFGGQEPTGNPVEFANILKYVVPGGGYVVNPRFQFLQRADVNGDKAHPLWAFARSQCPSVMDIGTYVPTWSPITSRDVSWNWESFLVDKTGVIFRRYAPVIDPVDVAEDIATLLAQ